MIDRNPASTVANAPVSSVQVGMQRSVASQSSALYLRLPSSFLSLISGFSRFQHANAFIDEWQTDRQG